MKSKLQLAKGPYGPRVSKSWDHHVWLLQMFHNTSGWRWVHLVQLRMVGYNCKCWNIGTIVNFGTLVHISILVHLEHFACCVFTRFNYKSTGSQRWVISATAMWLKLYQNFTHQLTAAKCGEIASLQCIFQTQISDTNVAAVVPRLHPPASHRLPDADSECIHKHAFMRIFTHQLGCMQSNAMQTKCFLHVWLRMVVQWCIHWHSLRRIFAC